MRVTARRRTLLQRPVAFFLVPAAALAIAAGASLARAQPPLPAPDAEAAIQPTQARDARMRLSSAQVQQAFSHIDLNRDGNLSRPEVAVYPRIERHFQRIDVNSDGGISPDEFEQALQQAS